MEETLGKRISANRKRLGITQDKLAEQLGVTAQAVSKWENDQSCPDITTLPRLADIFGISTDALLGFNTPEQEKVYDAEVVDGRQEDNEPEGIHVQKGNWEVRWDGGKKGGIVMALWVLLVGGLLLASRLLLWDIGLWDILWTTGLLVFGLNGLYPKFSFFNLLCALFGGYFLLDKLEVLPVKLGGELLLPVVVILLGVSLLAEALRKPRKGRFTVLHNGQKVSKHQTNYSTDGDTFECNASFGEDSRLVSLPRLRRGEINVSFGELTVDLSGCEEIAEDCRIEANCSFGELNLLIPRWYRIETDSSTSFASVEVEGNPDSAPRGIIHLDANANFGEIDIQYI